MDDFTKVSWLELRSYLVNTLLRDTDAMSMQHSLEVRVPFLDLPLVEYMLSLPESEKLKPRSAEIAAHRSALAICCPRKSLRNGKGRSRFRGIIGCAVRWESRREGTRGLVARARNRNRVGEFAADIWNDFLGGPHVLVASLEPVRLERMGEATSYRRQWQQETRPRRARTLPGIQLRRINDMIILGINAYHANASAADLSMASWSRPWRKSASIA